MIRIKHSRLIQVILASILLIVPELLFRGGVFTINEKSHVKELESFCINGISDANNEVNLLLNDTSTVITNINTKNALFLYNDSILIDWNSNYIQSPKQSILVKAKKQPQIYEDANGIHIAIAKSKNTYTAIAVLTVLSKYKFNNDYLPQSFTNELDLHKNFSIGLEKTNDFVQYPVKLNNKTFFYLNNDNPNDIIHHGYLFLLCVQVFGLLLFLFALMRYFFVLSHSAPYLATTIHTLLLIGIKIILSLFPVLTLLHQMDIFNPELFASGSFDPSLGDFLLSFVLLFYGVLLIYRNYFLFLQGIKARFKFYVYLSNIILIFALYSLINGLQSLVLNSQIDFFFKSIRSINEYTIIGICGLGLGLFTVLFILSRLRYFYMQYTPCLWYIIVMHVLGLSFCYYVLHLEIIYMQAILSLLCIIYIAWPEKYAFSPLNSSAIVLIVFSVIAANEFYHSTAIKEKNERLLMAEKILDSQDPDMETDASIILHEITNDTLLADYITGRIPIVQDSIENYLDKKYFNEILKDYKINYYLLTNDSIIIYPFNSKTEIINEHLRMIAFSGKMTASRFLYFIYNKTNGIDYLASVPLEMTPFGSKLNIEFISKKIPQRPGFEELLSNNNSFYTKLLSDYSHIKYVNNNIVEQRGNFLYKNNGLAYAKFNKKQQFYSEEGFDHLLFRPNSNSFVIISRPFTGWLTHVTSFSYILILFTTEFIAISLLLYRKKIRKGVFNLSAKIQFAFVVLTILAMTLFGVTTEYTISRQYGIKNKNLVAEKLESVNTEISPKLNGLTKLNNKNLRQILIKTSKVLKTDVNFFSPQGKLIASSIPEVYRYGIINQVMNPIALHRIKTLGMPRYIQEESLGKLNFIGGYLASYSNNQLNGYINVPYFARQNEVTNEFSSLLMAIINISVVLFAFTVVLSVIITQIIISPLIKIRESIAKMQLNKVNKPIFYKGKDELADLVKEYNNKVAELEKYTFYLAQSERESAWREMAKQVAHEIKNPLTPMRLNIQHMQRSLRKDDPEFEDKLQRICNSLVEQIDALTNIASEFSSMAKMPGIKYENISYYQLLENIIELYNDDDNLHITLNCPNNELLIYGDKEQLLRVLNNLVKNAQQAIPEDRQGEIYISVEKNQNTIVTTIKDNGDGIDISLKEKIFTPNFTTKTTGSGLGLIMVKNIIEQHKGKIWFESDKNGTSFIFELPIVK